MRRRKHLDKKELGLAFKTAIDVMDTPQRSTSDKSATLRFGVRVALLLSDRFEIPTELSQTINGTLMPMVDRLIEDPANIDRALDTTRKALKKVVDWLNN